MPHSFIKNRKECKERNFLLKRTQERCVLLKRTFYTDESKMLTYIHIYIYITLPPFYSRSWYFIPPPLPRPPSCPESRLRLTGTVAPTKRETFRGPKNGQEFLFSYIVVVCMCVWRVGILGGRFQSCHALIPPLHIYCNPRVGAKKRDVEWSIIIIYILNEFVDFEIN